MEDMYNDLDADKAVIDTKLFDMEVAQQLINQSVNRHEAL